MFSLMFLSVTNMPFKVGYYTFTLQVMSLSCVIISPMCFVVKV